MYYLNLTELFFLLKFKFFFSSVLKYSNLTTPNSHQSWYFSYLQFLSGISALYSGLSIQCPVRKGSPVLCLRGSKQKHCILILYCLLQQLWDESFRRYLNTGESVEVCIHLCTRCFLLLWVLAWFGSLSEISCAEIKDPHVQQGHPNFRFPTLKCLLGWKMVLFTLRWLTRSHKGNKTVNSQNHRLVEVRRDLGASSWRLPWLECCNAWL